MLVIAVRLGNVSQRRHVPVEHGVGRAYRRLLLLLHLILLELLRLPLPLLPPRRRPLLQRLGFQGAFLAKRPEVCVTVKRDLPI